MKSDTAEAMVATQLARRGISNPQLLDAFIQVDRRKFVPEAYLDRAYADSPLPIGDGQTISQPYIVALMAESLELGPEDRVLEIGTGSGYAAAIMSRLCREVFSVERLDRLAQEARERLETLGYDHIHVRCGDGTLGWPEHAPYDAITVAAGGPRIPEALLAQLAPRGRLVMPVGPDSDQILTRVLRLADSEFRYEALSPVRFVPLIGEQGVPE
jgi:protein-L-isoaspartate(D-aspartate) O-methyltransferase